MPIFSVFSKPWDERFPILDDGTGPSETTCAYAEVEAASVREAMVLAVRKWRSERKGSNRTYIRDCESDARSPFTGLKAERWCDDCGESEDKVCAKHLAEAEQKAGQP